MFQIFYSAALSSLGCLYSPSVVVSSLDVLRVGQLKCKGSYDVTKRQAVEDICSAAVELQEIVECVKIDPSSVTPAMSSRLLNGQSDEVLATFHCSIGDASSQERVVFGNISCEICEFDPPSVRTSSCTLDYFWINEEGENVSDSADIGRLAELDTMTVLVLLLVILVLLITREIGTKNNIFGPATFITFNLAKNSWHTFKDFFKNNTSTKKTLFGTEASAEISLLCHENLDGFSDEETVEDKSPGPLSDSPGTPRIAKLFRDVPKHSRDKSPGTLTSEGVINTFTGIRSRQLDHAFIKPTAPVSRPVNKPVAARQMKKDNSRLNQPKMAQEVSKSAESLREATAPAPMSWLGSNLAEGTANQGHPAAERYAAERYADLEEDVSEQRRNEVYQLQHSMVHQELSKKRSKSRGRSRSRKPEPETQQTKSIRI